MEGAGSGPEGPMFGFCGLPCLQHSYEKQDQDRGIPLPPTRRSFISSRSVLIGVK